MGVTLLTTSTSDQPLGGVLTNTTLTNLTTDFATLQTALGTGTAAAPTGSGAVVLQTTPTLTTPILGAAVNSSMNYIASETGANNAIVGTMTNAPALAAGLRVTVKLGHSLQAGGNTFAYAGGGAVAIKSAKNVANNIGTAYAATGVIDLLYDGTEWVDMSQ